MSASKRYFQKVRSIRNSLERGNSRIKDISEDTGIHTITIRERLIEAMCWGAVDVDAEDNWSLKK